MNAHTSNRFHGVLGNTLIVTVVVLLAWLSTLHERRFDLTSAARHGLSDASRELLRQVPGQVTVEVYAGRLAQRQPAERFLGRYRQAGLDMEIRYIDPLARPDLVRERGVERNGEIVLEYQGATEQVRPRTGDRPGYAEQDFSLALQRLLSGRRALLQFIIGHGERKPLGGGNHDLDGWASLLKQHGYRIRLLDLSDEGVAPEVDASLVLAGPRVALLPSELRLLDSYLQAGGNLLWLTDPGELHEGGLLLESLGLERPPGNLLSRHPGVTEDPSLVLAGPGDYLEHPALEKFSYLTLFPEAAPLQAKSGSGWTAHVLVQSGDQSWLESGPLSGHVQYDPDKDRKGPLPLVLALERPHPRTDGPRARQRVVVTGDGDFLSNTFIRNGGNAELGILLVNWLSVDVDARSFFTSAEPADTRLNMSPRMQNAFMLSCILGLPLVLLGTGWSVQRRRRNR